MKLDAEKRHREVISYLEQVAKLSKTELGSAAFYTLDRIDSKTATMLTHVSLMMTILTVMFMHAGGSPAIKIAMRTELFFYLAITIGSLYSIAIVKPARSEGDSGDESEENYRRVYWRIFFYRFSLIATLVNTLAFMATLLLEWSLGF